MGHSNAKNTPNPWYWIPSLYLAEGIPYIMVMTVAGILFKRFGISNTDIALYTSWWYLPWVIKPLWSPVVDLFKTKRWWITTMQFFIGIGLAGVALSLPGNDFFRYSLVFFWLLAFSSATHDTAADGFYMYGLNPRQQAYFVGIRSTFYRLALIIGQGLAVMLAGTLEKRLPLATAWSIAIGSLAVLFFFFAIYHLFILPKPSDDRQSGQSQALFKEFIDTFVSFFRKKHIGQALCFMLLFRLAESQLLKLASPFMLDSRTVGGLGLDTSEVGFIYGTIGIIALAGGGILGGIVTAHKGLGYWMLWMTIAMNIPNLVYVYLAYAQPENLLLISSCVAIEQFGYGFGFTAYILYLILFSAGEHKTAHYALCTGFMALGLMLPGMGSGYIQEHTSYLTFFMWVMLCTIPSFLLLRFVKIPEN
ncbi:MFS transporter [uncultured Odoribacter sp.]|uniref:MFS transporter n=1 Tax=uncultured Odoribacter sp. TaxID=876416 RepID=UPI0026125A41|nr:MFS transporter [uncultured Odoribacter sp.]